jgi:hypothetical protein
LGRGTLEPLYKIDIFRSGFVLAFLKVRGREAADWRVNSAFRKARASPDQKISDFETGSRLDPVAADGDFPGRYFFAGKKKPR